MNNYKKLDTLLNSKSICLISHTEPDADALSSMVVFREFIKNHYNINSIDLFAEYTSLYDTSNEILVTLKLNKNPKKYDTAIILDCPNTERLGKYQSLFKNSKTKIVIDHHSTNDYTGDINIVENCSSTCEIIYNILKFFKYKISVKNQGKLYAGIITDTNNFALGNITSNTFKIASEFNKNINREEIFKQFLNTKSYKTMQLLSIAIQNIVIFNHGNIIISHISNEEAAKFKAKFKDFTGIINEIAKINTAKLICFIQPNNNQYYVSLRAKNGYNISQLAKSQGGGGHIGAAAYSTNKTIKEIEQFILLEFEKILNNTKIINKKLF